VSFLFGSKGGTTWVFQKEKKPALYRDSSTATMCANQSASTVGRGAQVLKKLKKNLHRSWGEEETGGKMHSQNKNSKGGGRWENVS